MRRKVYPRWVGQSKMTQAKADHEIAVMERVLETLRTLSGAGKLEGAKPLVLFFRTEADRQEMVAAIAAEKPGMIETSIFDG